MDSRGLLKGCRLNNDDGWIFTHHSLDGKTHLALGTNDIVCDTWPIENPQPVPIRAEVIKIFGDIYPEWPNA